jgi:predicted nucleic acid-binding protein
VKFWDSSAVVPIVVEQSASAFAHEVFAADRHMAVWWGTEVEVEAALVRALHQRQREAGAFVTARERFSNLTMDWFEVQPDLEVKQRARVLLRAHYPLRASDAFQLAAAFVAASGRPTSLPFVCTDQRLAAAAEREGFAVIAPRSG